MKKNMGNYIPFLHENYEFKKNVLELARKQPITFEGIHVATLIYVNAVDYIAQHLLENLVTITYLLTNKELNSVAFFDQKQFKGLPLGKTYKELDNYQFPDKEDFLLGLKEFTEIRNRLVHNLLSLSNEQISKINEDFEKIKELSEGLINKYDILTKGITESWIAYLSRLNTTGNAPVSTTEEVNQEVAGSNNDKIQTKKK